MLCGCPLTNRARCSFCKVSQEQNVINPKGKCYLKGSQIYDTTKGQPHSLAYIQSTYKDYRKKRNKTTTPLQKNPQHHSCKNPHPNSKGKKINTHKTPQKTKTTSQNKQTKKTKPKQQTKKTHKQIHLPKPKPTKNSCLEKLKKKKKLIPPLFQNILNWFCNKYEILYCPSSLRIQ